MLEMGGHTYYLSEEDEGIRKKAAEKYIEENGELNESDMIMRALRKYANNPVDIAEKIIELDFKMEQLKEEIKTREKGDLRSIGEVYHNIKEKWGEKL